MDVCFLHVKVVESVRRTDSTLSANARLDGKGTLATFYAVCEGLSLTFK